MKYYKQIVHYDRQIAGNCALAANYPRMKERTGAHDAAM